MKFTFSWLKDHLETTASAHEIAEKLVTLGLEVESLTDLSEKLKGFVVGYVVECGKHPHADRLSLCKVDAGTGELIQVVCGAHNVHQGMKAVFAPIGTVIPDTGQPLKKGTIRQIDSFGMLCSARELELGEDSDGILDLKTEAKPGTPFAEVIGQQDIVFELAITPNRSDCFGVRGIARDLAAAGMGKLCPLIPLEKPGTFKSPISIEILDSKACPDFRGVYIKGVKNGSSPDWVQNRLKAVGLRPINALVDMTNYLTIDLCRPLHVFDADKLQGNLTVGLSSKGEELEVLNNKSYTLSDGMIVIRDDSKKAISLGGIMGGISTACDDKTTNVYIECAIFDPIQIANMGRALQVLSDSRTRLERGVDPKSLDFGVEAAIRLVLDWCGGEASIVEIAHHRHGMPPKLSQRVIDLTKHKLQSLSGYNLSLDEGAKYLKALGFEVISQGDSIKATVPTHRPDVEGAADLVEEILRMVGYDNIPSAPLPQIEPLLLTKTPSDISRQTLTSRGLLEVVSWSFMDEAKAKLFGWHDSSLKLYNPISNELGVMRPSALPNLIDAAIRNDNRGMTEIAFFEVGPIFHSGHKDHQKQQTWVATGLRAGKAFTRHWLEPQRSPDPYDVKADVCSVLLACGLTENSYQIENGSCPDYYHPGRSGVIKQGNRILAYFGEIHPRVTASFDTKLPLVGFEVMIDNLPLPKNKKVSLSLSPYQPFTRDFAFIVDDTVKADQLVKSIQKVDKSLITQVNIFDVYQGEKVGTNKKSIALEVRIEPQSGTLTDAQIQELSDKIISQVSKATGATLR